MVFGGKKKQKGLDTGF